VARPELAQILPFVDVLVDGPYMENLRDESLHFRGSSNQRLIDVNASLQEGKIIEFKS
jgi:anaerobic ribonucleoside-triphosphate reductase activating protein